MHRAKLVMNMTSMLDILIILFFAQAIENKDKIDKDITVRKQEVENLQSVNSELKNQVISLENDKDKLANKNIELTNNNKNLTARNNGLKTDLSKTKDMLKQKTEELAQKTDDLKNKETELKKIKAEIHLVGEKFNSEKILEELQLNKKEISKEEATTKVIEFIHTQRDIQKQTEKEIAIWIITLGNTFDNRDNKAKLILRLFIRGKEIDEFRNWSKDQPWDWKTRSDKKKYPENLKSQLLEALNNKSVIPDTEIHQINIILCFKENTKNAPNKKSLLTPQIDAFNMIFMDLFLQLQDTYNKEQSSANPNGRGKNIRLIPIPFDPKELHSLDPELLIK